MHSYGCNVWNCLLVVAYFEWEHGDLVWHVNVVPHTEVATVLGNHYVAEGHPLNIGAVAEQRDTLLALKVIEVKLTGREGGRERGDLRDLYAVMRYLLEVSCP